VICISNAKAAACDEMTPRRRYRNCPGAKKLETVEQIDCDEDLYSYSYNQHIALACFFARDGANLQMDV
jgi:hypothetical protein